MQYLFSHIKNHNIDGIYEHHTFLDDVHNTVYTYVIWRKDNYIYSISSDEIKNGNLKYKRAYSNVDSFYYVLTNLVDISKTKLNYVDIEKYGWCNYCREYLIYHKATKL